MDRTSETLMDIPKEWTFENASVAQSFNQHVREQLPWYDLVTGAVATSSGASSPEIASQASPPANWPEAMTSTGTTTAGRVPDDPKPFHSMKAGGTR